MNPFMCAWTAGFAIGLFCATCIASFAGWIPASMGYTGDYAARVAGAVHLN
jgi:hypothetical protein